MALLEHRPVHVRRMIAAGIALGVGFILLVLLVIVYTTKEPEKDNQSGSKIKDFYTTVVERGQAFIGGK